MEILKRFLVTKKEKGLVKEIIKSNSSKLMINILCIIYYKSTKKEEDENQTHDFFMYIFFFLVFSVDCLLQYENVSIEKLGLLTQPNFHLVFDLVMTAQWKFCMRLPCFQSAQIQTKLST